MSHFDLIAAGGKMSKQSQVITQLYGNREKTEGVTFIVSVKAVQCSCSTMRHGKSHIQSSILYRMLYKFGIEGISGYQTIFKICLL